MTFLFWKKQHLWAASTLFWPISTFYLALPNEKRSKRSEGQGWGAVGWQQFHSYRQDTKARDGSWQILALTTAPTCETSARTNSATAAIESLRSHLLSVSRNCRGKKTIWVFKPMTHLITNLYRRRSLQSLAVLPELFINAGVRVAMEKCMKNSMKSINQLSNAELLKINRCGSNSAFSPEASGVTRFR